MNITRLENVKSKGEARDIAIEWQQWFRGEKMFMSDFVRWQDAFDRVAKKYRLVREFKENGIV